MFYRRLIIITAALLSLSVPAVAAPFVYVGITSSFPSATTTSIRVLDSQTLDTIATIALPAGQAAKSIVLGLGDRRAYVATGDDNAGTGALVVIDTTTNTVLTTVPLAGVARGVALSTDHQRVFIAHDPSLVSVFSTADHALLGQVSVGSTPSDVVASPDGTTVYVGDGSGVTAVATSTLAVTRTTSTPRADQIAVAPDGREVYVTHGGQSHSISIINTASGVVESIPFSPLYPHTLLVMPDGATIWISSVRADVGGGGGKISIFDTASRSFTGTVDVTRALDGALDAAAHLAYFIVASGNFGVGTVYVMDTDTKQLARLRSLGLTSVTAGAIAVGNPGGCAFQVTPASAVFGPPGGSGTISIPAPAGCTWSVTSPVPWISVASPSTGTGLGTVSYAVVPNSGDPRAASLSVIAAVGQAVLISQTVPYMWIDEPVAGSTVNQPFDIRGWAIVRDANPAICCGSFVDGVQIQAIPAGSSTPITLGPANTNVSRPDIQAAFGSGYTNAGFNFGVRNLAAGSYTLVVNARSARTGQIDTRSVTVTVRAMDTSQPAGFVEAPREGDEVTQPFLVAGWAADLWRASGTGVDAVNVYAYPETGAAPIFLGSARYGIWPRPDVGIYYSDSAMSGSGFFLLASGLSIGRYRIVAFAHSTVTGDFFPRSVTVNVIGSSEAIMQIDIAQTVTDLNRACCGVRLIGWAADRRATSGSGISTVHVWAYPENGAAPIFLFAAPPVIDRDIPTYLFGSQFTKSGFDQASSALPTGTYRVVAYALSTVTGTFDAVRVVRVVIP